MVLGTFQRMQDPMMVGIRYRAMIRVLEFLKYEAKKPPDKTNKIWKPP